MAKERRGTTRLSLGPLLALALALGLGAYPGRRVLHWFEYATDTESGQAIAGDAQDVLREIWDVAVRSGVIDPTGEVARALAEAFLQVNATSLVELAAGGGGASIHWTQELRRLDIPARCILTDLKPNVQAWERLAELGSDMVSYMPEPLDAMRTDPRLAEHRARAITFALHHFPPPLARELLAEIVRSRSMLLVGDLAPNRWTLTLNGPIALLVGLRWFFQDPLNRLRAPQHSLLLPFAAVHDGTVSVLRAYSKDELRELVEGLPGSEDYEWKFFDSGNVLSVVFGAAARPITNAPWMHFGILAPR